MPTNGKIKELFDHHFAAPFLPEGVVKCTIENGLLRIKILRRDIEIDEDGELHGAGTDVPGLEQRICDECDPDNYGWIFNRVGGKAACGCMTEAEPFQILREALEQIADPNGPQSGVACAMVAREALRSALPLDYAEPV